MPQFNFKQQIMAHERHSLNIYPDYDRSLTPTNFRLRKEKVKGKTEQSETANCKKTLPSN